MLRYLIGAMVVIVLHGEIARAQVVGDSPNTGIGAAVANTPMRGILGLSHGLEGSRPIYQTEERAYQEALRKIPDRKRSNDPWGNIRRAPAASSLDRHRVQ
jgi:hypothetical protein